MGGVLARDATERGQGAEQKVQVRDDDEPVLRHLPSVAIPHFHPHDLRHRYASVKLRKGVRAQLGHATKSMTLDTYTHVLLS
jgi:integrase